MLFLDKIRIIIIASITLLIIVYIYDFAFIYALGAVYNRRIRPYYYTDTALCGHSGIFYWYKN